MVLGVIASNERRSTMYTMRLSHKFERIIVRGCNTCDQCRIQEIWRKCEDAVKTLSKNCIKTKWGRKRVPPVSTSRSLSSEGPFFFFFWRKSRLSARTGKHSRLPMKYIVHGCYRRNWIFFTAHLPVNGWRWDQRGRSVTAAIIRSVRSSDRRSDGDHKTAVINRDDLPRSRINSWR